MGWTQVSDVGITLHRYTEERRAVSLWGTTRGVMLNTVNHETRAAITVEFTGEDLKGLAEALTAAYSQHQELTNNEEAPT